MEKLLRKYSLCFLVLLVGFVQVPLPLLSQAQGSKGPRLPEVRTLAGIFQPTDAEMQHLTSRSWEAFQQQHTSQNAAGFRLLDLETSWEAGERTFHGLYTHSPLEDAVERIEGWDNFIATKRQRVKDGYTMIDVAAVANNESDYDFYGVWVKQDPEIVHKVWFLNVEDVVEHTNNMAQDRFKIKRVHVLPVPNGEPRFIVLYHFSAIDRYNFLYITENWAEFQQEIWERKKSKVELIDYARYRQGDKTMYLGVFQDGEYESDFLHNVQQGEMKAKADSVEAELGLKLVNISVN